MTLFVKLLLIAALSAIAIILFRKLVFAFFNYKDVSNKEISADISRQRNGMVFNLETNELEADQSIIPPFE